MSAMLPDQLFCVGVDEMFGDISDSGKQIQQTRVIDNDVVDIECFVNSLVCNGRQHLFVLD